MASLGRSVCPRITRSTGSGRHTTVCPLPPSLSPQPALTTHPPTVTWDTSFFPTANTTLKIHGVYNTNETTIPDAAPHHGEDEAFSSEEIDAGWGYYQWRLDKHLLTNRRVGSANITVRIVALPSNGQPAQWLSGPTINLQWKPKDPPKPRPVNNDAQALYIALPLVFGFATLMIVGTFFWNRRLRHIGMPSVMGRPRRLNRKKGPGASRKDRAGNTNKEQGIRLMEHGGDGSDGEDWTEGWSHEVPGRDSEEPGTRVFESKVGKKRM
jgi:hypothetical protein